MKITDITAYPVWAGHRNFLFVVVDTDEGIYGVGESGLTSREQAVIGAFQDFKEVLVGQDPFRIEHIWQLLFRGGFFPAQRVLSSAISAIDIALWDIKGKALGVPIYELLGGRVRDKVVCYPHNHSHAMEVEPLVESCLETKEQGWKFVRWGLPQDGDILEPRDAVRTAIRQFEAVRAAVGDEIDICFDVHTRLDLPDVIWLCREVEQYAPFFIEDPLRCENPDSFKTLRPRTHVPLAAGEQFSSKWEFRQLIEEEWIDYARVDMCIAGGFTEARKIAGWCETHYIKLVVHNPLGPGLVRSLSANEPGDLQLWRAGATPQTGRNPARRRARPTRLGRRLHAADRPARAWHRVRQRGGRPPTVPEARAATVAPP